MCGVAGVYAYSGSAAPVDRGELRAVRDHMAARGPDGSGEWFSTDGRVGLAHRRLSIIDLSDRAAQPMASADGALVTSFNGEIYNYRELKAQLQARGRVFRTESDTEVLLQLYDEYGSAMLEMLRGMFAFALWDSRKRAMLLARDPFGIKPLYYADDGKALRVASQVKALLRCPVDTSPEPAGHAGFFLWGSVPSPWTLYRGIRGLPAGHFMWVGEHGPSGPEPYCLVSDILARSAAEPAQGTQEEALEQIAAAMQDSVKAHLVSDVPVGVFLSSGLDSAMLASLTSAAGAQLRTLTLGFVEYAGTADDEVPLAERVARQFGARHSTVTVRRADFESERDRLLAAMDQPSIDGVNTWFVARAAASQGMKVALSGLGGDELFGSYPSFREVPMLARLARLPARVPGLGVAVRRLSEPLVRRMTSPKYAGLLEYGGTLGGAYLLRRGLHMPWELPRLMDPDMAREGWRDLQTVARLDGCAANKRTPGGERLAISALEMSWYMRHQLLRDADWAGMAHSIEIRVPFVDTTLLKAVAPWIAAHPELPKFKVARAVASSLPEDSLHRPKAGFTVPVREWLGASSALSRGMRGWAGAVYGQHAIGCERERRGNRVLVSTLAPGHGGVNAMTSFVVRSLEARGLEPVIAHYAPYSITPGLSVPSFRLLQRRTGSQLAQTYGGHETHAIGAWLPELEFTHYAATRYWRSLMESCDAFVAVSGNVLAATPYWQTGRPFVAWVATDWQGDREDRVKAFAPPRQLFDALFVKPVAKRLERKLLASGSILPLSAYTSRMLKGISDAGINQVSMPMGVDCAFFSPGPAAVVAGKIGFVGRFTDPRKNVELFARTIAQLRRSGRRISGLLVGDNSHPHLLRLMEELELTAHIELVPTLPRTMLLHYLHTLDVFVVPSHQEGLCIAALEAMACGIPVVSTRCGGPEEFVIPGVTGTLVDADPQVMAAAILDIVTDRSKRARMGSAARQLVEERYSLAHADGVLWRSMASVFPKLEAGAVAAS